MENAVACRENYGVVNFEDFAMPVASLIKQVALIQEVMTSVMHENEHYGVIPGTKKPSLWKPGAEKLCMVFRLEPDYEIIREFREESFIAYTVRCSLIHIPTGQKIASGVGSCNSREAKYRFRNEYSLTDEKVPTAYWDAKKAGNSQEMKRILGPGNIAKKNEETNKWVIAAAQQVENENPWDLDNTLVKMACKRALIAGVLNATAASDIFTQDDDPPAGGEPEPEGKPPIKQPQKKQSEPQKEIQNPDDPATENQIKAIQSLLTALKITDDLEKHQTVSALLELPDILASFSALKKGQASEVIKKLGEHADRLRQGEGK